MNIFLYKALYNWVNTFETVSDFSFALRMLAISLDFYACASLTNNLPLGRAGNQTVKFITHLYLN